MWTRTICRIGVKGGVRLGSQAIAERKESGPGGGGGGDGFLSEVTGKVEGLIGARENMPDSGGLMADIAGTRGGGITTQQTHAPAAGHGSPPHRPAAGAPAPVCLSTP